jgi:hypothetical protein
VLILSDSLLQSPETEYFQSFHLNAISIFIQLTGKPVYIVTCMSDYRRGSDW